MLHLRASVLICVKTFFLVVWQAATFTGWFLSPGPEDSGADADPGGAAGDGDFEVRGHAHGQDR
jgi:hypothetical protein